MIKTYKIYECEEKATPNGKMLKKMVLKDASNEQANTEPRVTLWEDHPQYASAVAGGTIDGYLEKKDSGTPIPQYPGKNYINRTLLAEVPAQTNPNGTIAPTVDPHTLNRIAALEQKVATLMGETAPTAPQTEEINPDDIPF